jgi:hypothetical protein
VIERFIALLMDLLLLKWMKVFLLIPLSVLVSYTPFVFSQLTVCVTGWREE